MVLLFGPSCPVAIGISPPALSVVEFDQANPPRVLDDGGTLRCPLLIRAEGNFAARPARIFALLVARPAGFGDDPEAYLSQSVPQAVAPVPADATTIDIHIDIRDVTPGHYHIQTIMEHAA